MSKEYINFLKRFQLEVGINSYNKNVLKLMEANMDLSVDTDAYNYAFYVINYISKIDSGWS